MSYCCPTVQHRRRGNIFSFLVNVIVSYVLLIVIGGTLINTGHPVAIEAGRIIHLITFVEPLTLWAQAQHLQPLAQGLAALSNGVPLPHMS